MCWGHLGLFVCVFLVTVCFLLSSAQLKPASCKRVSPNQWTQRTVASYEGTTKGCQAIPRASDSRRGNEWSLAPSATVIPANPRYGHGKAKQPWEPVLLGQFKASGYLLESGKNCFYWTTFKEMTEWLL